MAVRDQIEAGWRSTIERFSDHLAHHTALCRTGLVLGKKLGMGRVPITVGHTREHFGIAPAEAEPPWLGAKRTLAIEKGATEAQLTSRVLRYTNCDLSLSARGKTVFQVLSAFVAAIKDQLGITLRGEWNAATHWIRVAAVNDGSFNYLRIYARSRNQVFG